MPVTKTGKGEDDTMRIAMIGHKKVPSRLGGVEIHVEELGARLAALGHEVDLYNRAINGVDGTTYKGMNIFYVKSMKIPGFAALTYSFRAALKTSFMDYDIIHFHALGPSAAGIIPRILGKKVVSTVHGLDWQRAKWKKAGVRFLKVGEWVTGRFFNRVIVVSKPLTEYFRRKYDQKERFVYIPNGITTEGSKTGEERKQEAEHISRTYKILPGNYYLFVSRLVREKACHMMIKAFIRTKTQKKLIIAGDNPEDQNYVKELQMMSEADPRIMMVGFKDIEELHKLYDHTFCYILPSEIEGLPISLLEAMSHGCYCLTSDIDENKEVLQGFGKTFHTKDVESLQSALEEIEIETHSITEAYGQGETGRQQSDYIINTYNWNEVAEQTESLYKSLLKR